MGNIRSRRETGFCPKHQRKIAPVLGRSSFFPLPPLPFPSFPSPLSSLLPSPLLPFSPSPLLPFSPFPNTYLFFFKIFFLIFRAVQLGFFSYKKGDFTVIDPFRPMPWKPVQHGLYPEDIIEVIEDFDEVCGWVGGWVIMDERKNKTIPYGTKTNHN